MEDSARCSKHPRDRAGWVCRGCGLELCVRCAARRKAGTGFVIVCLQCGAYAQPIMVPRARTPYSKAVAGAFVFPFSRNGFLLMLAFGAVMSVLEMLGPVGWAVALAMLLSYLFLVVRSSSTGHTDLPESEDFSDLQAVGTSLGKALLVFLGGLAPCLLYVFYGRSAPTDTAFEDPITYVLLALGFAWVPVALMLAAVNSPLSTVFNPSLGLQCVKRLGADYAVCAGLVWGAVAGWLFLHTTGILLMDVFDHVPVLPRIVGESATMYPAIVGGRILGMLLYVRGADIDYGTSSDHLEPALGGLLPPEEKGGAELPPLVPGAQASVPPPTGQLAQAGALANLLNGGPAAAASASKPSVAPAPKPAAAQPSQAPSSASRPAPSRPQSPPAQSAPSQPSPVKAAPAPAEPKLSDWGSTAAPAAAGGWADSPAPAPAPAEDDALLMEAILGPMGGAAAPPPAAPVTQSSPTMMDLPDLPPPPVLSAPPPPPMPKSVPKSMPPPAMPKTVVVTPPSDDEIGKLAVAGDYEAVANAYRARKGAVTGLTPDQLIRTAEAAMARSDQQTASHAYKRVGYDHPKSPNAPKALLAAARILRDLKKDAEGTKLLTHLVKSYPASPEAEEARSLLERAA